MSELYYVTGNVGKYEEVRDFINRNVDGLNVHHIDIDLIEFQTTDMLSIALNKARQAWKAVGKPVLVDDSGVYFDKYLKFPGTLTKFLYHGVGMEGICKLIQPGDKAHFILHMVYMDGPESYQVFEGLCRGYVIIPSVFRARPELPYDDIFVPEGLSKTYGNIRDTPEFDEYSYRLRAIKKFIAWYQNQQQEINGE